MNDFRRESGFTLIESVVAMGLFAGVVLLLISTFNAFASDDYASKLGKALVVGENAIERAEQTHIYETEEKDTLRLHMTQSIQADGILICVEVVVRDATRSKIEYVRLFKLMTAH